MDAEGGERAKLGESLGSQSDPRSVRSNPWRPPKALRPRHNNHSMYNTLCMVQSAPQQYSTHVQPRTP